MRDFRKKAIEHLKNYKEKKYPGCGCGEWRKIKQDHVFTNNDGYLNFTFPVSPNSISGKTLSLPDHSAIILHQDWTHLNSSQVLCISYFYPFMQNIGGLNDVIRFINEKTNLNIPETACGCEFEVEKADKTNVDFVIDLDEEQDGKKVYFEIKYTETEFGVANKTIKVGEEKVIDNAHYEKWQQKYHSDAHITFYDYKKNYQFVRNVCLAQNGSYTIFLIPKGNDCINNSYENGIQKIKNKESFAFARIYWEDLLEKIPDNIVKKKYFDF